MTILAHRHSQVNSWQLSQWLDWWQSQLKKPEEIIFSRTVRNIAEYLSEELPKFPTRAVMNYDAWLLDKIREEFGKRNIELSVLKECDRNAVQNLQNLLNASPLDLVATGKAFERIVELYHSEVFKDAIETEFKRNIRHPVKSSQKKIYNITFLLLRNLLRDFSVEHLTDLPLHSFAKSFISIHASQFRQAIELDPQLPISLVSVVQHISNVALGNAGSIQPTPDLYDEILHDRSRWMHNVERIIIELKVKLEGQAGVIEGIFKTDPSSLEQQILSTPDIELLLKNFCDAILNQISDQLTDRTIQYRDILLARGPDFTHNSYRDRIAEIMDSIAPTHTHGQHSMYHGFVAETLKASIHQWYSETLANESALEAVNMQKLFASIVFTKLFELIKSQGNITIENVKTQLFRFELKEAILKGIESETKRILPLMLRNILSLSPKLAEADSVSNLLKIHTDRTLAAIPRPSYYRSEFLQNLTDEMILTMLHDFFDKIRAPPTEWYVFHEVSDLDCNGKMFEIQHALFFDARTWDFGEGATFDPHQSGPEVPDFRSTYYVYDTYKKPNIETLYRRNSGRVRTKVKASDEGFAISLARIKTTQAMSTMVFSNSGDFGFRPYLPLWSYVADSELSPIGTHGRSGEHSSTLKIDDKQMVTTEFYNKLMQWQNIETRNSLEKALSWFHNARWEEVPHVRFVSFWISLEHLISKEGASSKNRLLKYIPNLVANWRNSGDWSRSITHHLQLLINEVKSDQRLLAMVNSTPSLGSFDDDYAIILGNLPLLSKMLRGTPQASTLAQVRRFVRSRSRNLKWMYAEVNNKRQDYRFKTAMIYQKRHRLVHEGLSYAMELSLYNKVLQQIAWETLVILIEEYELDLDLDRTLQKLENPLPVN
jgi:hypothetical protein